MKVRMSLGMTKDGFKLLTNPLLALILDKIEGAMEAELVSINIPSPLSIDMTRTLDDQPLVLIKILIGYFEVFDAQKLEKQIRGALVALADEGNPEMTLLLASPFVGPLAKWGVLIEREELT